MSMNRPLCQSVCGSNCNIPYNQGFGSILAHHNNLASSYAEMHPSQTVDTDKVFKRLESAENMLKQMDRKVDILRHEKQSTTKQLKKLTKRITSVSMSRDSLPLTARNFGQPTTRKLIKRSKEVSDSQMNLVLSDSKSNNSRNAEVNPRKKNLNNSRYTKEYKQYEEEQEVAIDTSTEKVSYKNFTGATHTSSIKHAIADLADNSNDYSEDMDESVAFTKAIASDKENKDVSKLSSSKPNKYLISKRPKKTVKTNKTDLSGSKPNPLNYTSNPKIPRGFVVNQPEKRRSSYLK